MPMAPVAPAM